MRCCQLDKWRARSTRLWGNGGHNATCLSHHGWLAFRWIRELGINEAFWSQREWDRRVEPFPLHRSHAIIVSGFEKKDRSVI